MMINEIFYSIQGEGREMGLPTIFIRTTGCNLRCSYCDTRYAYEKGYEMTAEQIAIALKRFPCNRICLTGGEPLLQNEAGKMIRQLIGDGYEILVETNGSIGIRNFNTLAPGERRQLKVSLDIKCPCSGEEGKMNFSNIAELKRQDQLKFVIGSRTDYDHARNVLGKHLVSCPVYFNPVGGTDPKQLVKWVLEDGLNVHVGIQLHKIIWGEKRGV
ncbi:MAG: 7-carboxy-7-deazaguanine synthase QueE [Thermoplasmata archaeon HGW-Thermoplasmata-1]|nr:MAG: 7-carboxy-7-deazaguanine synthase QueE [Thermoplasmata archaeon HGW-Thermoplasmata-1]